MGDAPAMQIRIGVSSDAMEATLTVCAGADPEALVEDAIVEEIRERGVQIVAEVRRAVSEVLERHRRDPSKEHTTVVAHGRAPRHGEAEQVSLLPRFDPDSSESATEEDGETDASVDHYERRVFRVAEAGEHVANLIPAREGEDGWDVFGRTLTAKSPSGGEVALDETIKRGAEGRLHAAVSGLVRLERNALSIETALRIDGFVDFSTGNVSFEGDVVVQKGVRDNFLVACGAQLIVRGLVEAATIRANCARLLGGMAAREKGRLEIERDLAARYLDSVRGAIGRHMTFDKEVVNCRLSVGGRLTSERGAIIGGSLCVTGAATVDVVGSESASATELRLGRIAAVDLLRGKTEDLLPRIEERLGKTERDHETLVKNVSKLTATQAEQMTELQFEVSTLRALRDRVLGGVERMEEIVSAFAEPSLTVNGRAHRGVRLLIGSFEARFEQERRGPFRIELSEGGRPVLVDLIREESTDLRDVCTVRSLETGDRKGRQAA